MVKGITNRWIVNYLSVTILIVIALIFGLLFMVRSYYYESIKTTLVDKGAETITALSDIALSDEGYNASAEARLREYTENFADKELMELMIISSNGEVLFNTTGFEPDANQSMPDFDQAMISSDSKAFWKGALNSGENVIAYTQLLRNKNGDCIVGIRFVVSLVLADNKIVTAIFVIVAAFLLLLASFIIPGLLFLRTIVKPVRELSATAKRIAQGDYETKVAKRYDDEVGELADSINYMSEEIKASDTLKNDFISSVSHELRTPLTAIKGWAETMSIGEPDPVTMNKGLNIIINETGRLARMVEELLDFSRIQSGRMGLVTGKMDLLAELDEAVYMLKERAISEKKHLIYDHPENVTPVLGDKNRLRQVFINIIDNALKYTPEDGEIGIQVVEHDEMIFVIITDTGCGIKKEDLPRIKDKFYKANQTVRGSGIGLAVADEIINLHKGKLEIDSVEGEGTTVTISLPVLDSDDEKILQGDNVP